MKTDKELAQLTDPTKFFYEGILKDCRARGQKIANKYFDGEVAYVTGEVLGDMLACAVMGGI